jgi:hypothetical protein
MGLDGEKPEEIECFSHKKHTNNTVNQYVGSKGKKD